MKTITSYPALLILTTLSFIPTLFYYYVGEEAVYTISSIEMWQNQNFFTTMLYGGSYGRPPLFNWIMIPITLLTGWDNILIASRIVTVTATLLTGVILAWLAQQLWHNKIISWTTIILYLITADVALYRGWLSYADPLFSMFIVLSVALIWASCLRQSYIMLFTAIFIAFAAFLTKALTVYVFIGISILVLFENNHYRRFLLNPRALVIYICAILLPVIWLKYGAESSQLNDATSRIEFKDTAHFLLRSLKYLVEILLRTMPASLFIGYFLLYKREILLNNPAVRTSLLIAGLNLLPFLFAGQGFARYVLPIYPFIVLPASYLVVQNTHPFNIKKWLIVILIIESILKVFAFPYYQKTVRGKNHFQMAQEIVSKFNQYPLYIKSDTSIALSVAAYIDIIRLDHPAITSPPRDLKDGIVIAARAEDFVGQLLKPITFNGYSVYLICRGSACNTQSLIKP